MKSYAHRIVSLEILVKCITAPEGVCGFERNSGMVSMLNYCVTKISIQAKRSISRVFSLFIVPRPFLYIARTKAILTGLKAY